MGSTANPNNPWGQYDSYKDCSQGVCSVYCPQWCYVIFPPPPSFFFDEEDDSSSSDFSPLLIALIGILASAFILVSYYTLISKYCHRRRQISSSSSTSASTNREISVIDSWQGSNGAANQNQNTGDGLDESLIKSIKVYKFKKGDGFVESSDCSVCLSEFEENENLRLLPKCNHAFHLPCIDTWLKSHSNCPLCRCFIAGIESVSVSLHQISTGSDSVSLDLSDEDDSVVVHLDLESARSEETEKPPEEESAAASVVLISDILRESEDEDEEVGSSSRRFEEGDGEKTPPPPPSSDGKSSFLVRSSMAMKRSVSNGKFVISRNHRLPN